MKKKMMVFVLVFLLIATILYTGFEALSGDQQRVGLAFIFVGVMTVIGLVMDVVNHLKSKRTM